MTNVSFLCNLVENEVIMDNNKTNKVEISDISEVLSLSKQLSNLNITAVNNAGVLFTNTNAPDRKYNNKGVITLVEKDTGIEIGYVSETGKVKLARTWYVNRHTMDIQAKYRKNGWIGNNDLSTKMIVNQRTILNNIKPRLLMRQANLKYLSLVKSTNFTLSSHVQKWFTSMLRRGWTFHHTDYHHLTFGGFNVRNHSVSLLTYSIKDPETNRILHMDMSVTSWNDDTVYLWLVNADRLYIFDIGYGRIEKVNTSELEFTPDFERLMKIRTAFKHICEATSKSVAYTFLYTHTFWPHGRYSFMFDDGSGKQVDWQNFTKETPFKSILVYHNDKKQSIATITYRDTGKNPGWYIEMPNYGTFHLCGKSHSRHMLNVLDKLCNESSRLINRIPKE